MRSFLGLMGIAHAIDLNKSEVPILTAVQPGEIMMENSILRTRAAITHRAEVERAATTYYSSLQFSLTQYPPSANSTGILQAGTQTYLKSRNYNIPLNRIVVVYDHVDGEKLYSGGVKIIRQTFTVTCTDVAKSTGMNMFGSFGTMAESLNQAFVAAGLYPYADVTYVTNSFKITDMSTVVPQPVPSGTYRVAWTITINEPHTMNFFDVIEAGTLSFLQRLLPEYKWENYNGPHATGWVNVVQNGGSSSYSSVIGDVSEDFANMMFVNLGNPSTMDALVASDNIAFATVKPKYYNNLYPNADPQYKKCSLELRDSGSALANVQGICDPATTSTTTTATSTTTPTTSTTTTNTVTRPPRTKRTTAAPKPFSPSGPYAVSWEVNALHLPSEASAALAALSIKTATPGLIEETCTVKDNQVSTKVLSTANHNVSSLLEASQVNQSASPLRVEIVRKTSAVIRVIVIDLSASVAKNLSESFAMRAMKAKLTFAYTSAVEKAGLTGAVVTYVEGSARMYNTSPTSSSSTTDLAVGLGVGLGVPAVIGAGVAVALTSGRGRRTGGGRTTTTTEAPEGEAEAAPVKLAGKDFKQQLGVSGVKQLRQSEKTINDLRKRYAALPKLPTKRTR